MRIAPRAWLRHCVSRWWVRQGTTHLRKSCYPQAIAAFARALPYHPKPADLLCQRGLAHWRNRDSDSALADFDRAIALNPSFAKAYGNRGLIYYDQGNVDRALANWNLALQHQPTYAEARYNRGLLLAQQQDYPSALIDFDQALKVNPNLVEAYLHRGDIRAELGDRLGAIKDWELALLNDLSLEPARKRLLAARKESRDLNLSKTLQDILNSDDLTVEAHVNGNHLDVMIDRTLGAAVNYFNLANEVRKQLQKLQLNGIRRFRLIGRVGDRGHPEWNQSYTLYDNVACPPCYWGLAVLSTTVLFPPLGLAALIFAAQIKPRFRRGDIDAAQHTSKIVKALIILSGGIFVLMLLTLISYLIITPSDAWNILPDFDNLPTGGPRRGPYQGQLFSR
ncbi:MAG: tetratricopeptide repeat protein [Kaiparowitsia implicata GSE-PSE-MK54-09C]|jgi:tetratricopeptide (TPR) repeat protein|nr:tetratricopeptide repeat protein [Kaiparowitsia implicata GSE-PSE-MK54-09C]